MLITLDAAKTIYRYAIDSRVSDVEGDAWWEEVADEMRDVIAARTLADAAALIDWWHRLDSRFRYSARGS